MTLTQVFERRLSYLSPREVHATLQVSDITRRRSDRFPRLWIVFSAVRRDIGAI